MKLAIWWGAFLLSLYATGQAAAVTVQDPDAPPPLAHDALLISAFSFDDTLRFVEIHNQSDRALAVSGWSVTIDYVTGAAVEEAVAGSHRIELEADGLLLPGDYLTIGRDDAVTGQSFSFTAAASDSLPQRITLSYETIQHTVILPESVSPLPYWYERRSGESGLSGDFGDFIRRTAATPEQPRDSGLYSLPTAPSSLQVVEIYPHASDCAPDQYEEVLCGDYVKLHNAGPEPIDLSYYRLRSDSGGEKSAPGNTVQLSAYGVLAPGGYAAVWVRDDGDDLSLTDSGGYVWVEDAAGISGPYTATITSYPSASSAARQGWAWAYDAVMRQWGWTMTPQPLGANLFTVPEPEVSEVKTEAKTLKPCAADQYRNPETNRCKRKEATPALASCAAGQERNPATNRCRSVLAVAATLVPCGEGEVRNPATNRCRKAVLSAAQLKPCAAGQERNPATNRCRKIAEGPADAGSAAEVGAITAAAQPWSYGSLVLGASVAAAAGYGVYEWRVELWRVGRRVISLTAKK